MAVWNRTRERADPGLVHHSDRGVLVDPLQRTRRRERGAAVDGLVAPAGQFNADVPVSLGKKVHAIDARGPPPPCKTISAAPSPSSQ